jgi:nucleotidyltransferase substrate binding protein (TIGR01987 family)
MDKKLTLIFDNLDKALKTLDKAVSDYQTKGEDKEEYIRDACIQRFEYCYDLSTKLIKRYLSLTSNNSLEIEEMTFQELIRKAYSKGLLLNSWDGWREYRERRNATSHGYNEKTAIEIASDLDVFSREIHFLLKKFQEKDEA